MYILGFNNQNHQNFGGNNEESFLSQLATQCSAHPLSITIRNGRHEKTSVAWVNNLLDVLETHQIANGNIHQITTHLRLDDEENTKIKLRCKGIEKRYATNNPTLVQA